MAAGRRDAGARASPAAARFASAPLATAAAAALFSVVLFVFAAPARAVNLQTVNLCNCLTPACTLDIPGAGGTLACFVNITSCSYFLQAEPKNDLFRPRTIHVDDTGAWSFLLFSARSVLSSLFLVFFQFNCSLLVVFGRPPSDEGSAALFFPRLFLLFAPLRSLTAHAPKPRPPKTYNLAPRPPSAPPNGKTNKTTKPIPKQAARGTTARRPSATRPRRVRRPRSPASAPSRGASA